jgi:hypothetical protein
MGGSGEKPEDASARFNESCLYRIGKAAANGAFWGGLGGAALQACTLQPFLESALVPHPLLYVF